VNAQNAGRNDRGRSTLPRVISGGQAGMQAGTAGRFSSVRASRRTTPPGAGHRTARWTTARAVCVARHWRALHVGPLG